ncbi:MAG: diacylglycerol kinase, partial [Gemmatimonadaceae bacterium]|nr:diacylglycerol kinase [Gemmatimonadaceae bacterium]
GSTDADATRETIESVLGEHRRAGTVHIAPPGRLSAVATNAARRAREMGSAVVAIGGDGTINTVAHAAHTAGCPLGVIPGGTFNYFAREHGVPADMGDALRWLLEAQLTPVQIAAINEQRFLVNASVGLYPELLQDRETWKARFGRSRLVAMSAGMATLFGVHRHLRLSIEWEGRERIERTLTLFVGNNRLQLEQLGLADPALPNARSATDGTLTAVLLKPISRLAMAKLVLRGALGTLGDADDIERLVCRRLVVRPPRGWTRQSITVAFDGEVRRMRLPLTIGVLPDPLWLLAGAPVDVSA